VMWYILSIFIRLYRRQFVLVVHTGL